MALHAAVSVDGQRGWGERQSADADASSGPVPKVAHNQPFGQVNNNIPKLAPEACNLLESTIMIGVALGR